MELHPQDEELLLAVLNSAPVEAGHRRELLDGPAGDELVRRFGGTGSAVERDGLRAMRDALQASVRGEPAARETLDGLLDGAALVPEATASGLRWRLQAPEHERLAARAALAWGDLAERMPGRLRACANEECNLFLLDRSRPGTARWCSMATCGNRMKARGHAARRRAGTA